MSNNKLSTVYDKAYDETYNQILEKNADHVETKRVIGEIYRDTKSMLTKQSKIEEIKKLFEMTKNRYAAG